ncbi:MAG: ATP-binding protein [Sphingobacteriales bacterium]
MKKYFLTAFLSLTAMVYCLGQVTSSEIIRRKKMLAEATSDTARINLLITLGGSYRFSKIDSTLYYDDMAISLARKVHATALEAKALSDKGSVILDSGDIPQAYIYMLQSQKVIGKAGGTNFDLITHGAVENRLGNLFMELGEYNTSIEHYRLSIFYYAKTIYPAVYNGWSNVGNDYELMGKLDSARYYQQRAYDQIKKDSLSTFFVYAETEGRLGNVERDMGHYNKALQLYRYGARNAQKKNDFRNLSVLYLDLGQLFNKLGQRDSGFYYARKTLAVSQQVSMKKSEYQAAELLSHLFKSSHQPDSALFYLSLSAKVKDELYGPKIFQQLQRLALSEQQRQQQLQEQNDELKYRYTIVGTVAGLGVILLIAIIIWRNYRKQKRTNLMLSEQKEEIETQRDNLGTALEELKNTQTQLVQREKMASLGELTAGIAHEIQNPLNFVNNFSEVNEEMLEELKAENSKPKAERDEQLENELINDLIDNQRKIKHHGKRAGSIVKGMLEHSRAGTGEKQPTDINALADEYLRLSYHGLRAKDKDFNAELVTTFDSGLPKANVVPQDINRVLLNLFNNAFYAVNQKKKTAGPDYKPTVEVSTSTKDDRIEIKVKDNGNGIPEGIKEKIMQPFFTTKPTGEGTGLGLSLSYDIVVKGHGGSISINTKESEFTEFIVKLPE